MKAGVDQWTALRVMVVGWNMCGLAVVLANFFPGTGLEWRWELVWGALVLDIGICIGYTLARGWEDGEREYKRMEGRLDRHLGSKA
jgi:hypothetical protein